MDTNDLRNAAKRLPKEGFYMSIPARPDYDADLLLAQAADEIDRLTAALRKAEADLIAARHWEVEYRMAEERVATERAARVQAEMERDLANESAANAIGGRNAERAARESAEQALAKLLSADQFGFHEHDIDKSREKAGVWINSEDFHAWLYEGRAALRRAMEGEK